MVVVVVVVVVVAVVVVIVAVVGFGEAEGNYPIVAFRDPHLTQVTVGFLERGQHGPNPIINGKCPGFGGG